MGNKENCNRFIIYIAIGAILLSTSISVGVSIHNNNLEKKYNNLSLTIKEAALKCKRDSICTSDKVFVQQLVDNKYISQLTNPKTNKIINGNSYINLTKNQVIIID